MGVGCLQHHINYTIISRGILKLLGLVLPGKLVPKPFKYTYSIFLPCLCQQEKLGFTRLDQYELELRCLGNIRWRQFH